MKAWAITVLVLMLLSWLASVFCLGQGKQVVKTRGLIATDVVINAILIAWGVVAVWGCK